MAKKRAADSTGDEVADAALAALRRNTDDDTGVLEGELLDDERDEEDPPPVSDELVFTTSERADEDADENDVLEIKLDGDTLWAIRPSKGAWTMALSSVSRAATAADRVHAQLQFVFASFDEPSQMLLQNRLLDPKDRFEIDDLSNIVSALIKKWAPEQSRAQRRQALRDGRRNGRQPARR